MPAFPIVLYPGTPDQESCAGLSKREKFASEALAACIVKCHASPAEAAKLAVEYADALLAELEK